MTDLSGLDDQAILRRVLSALNEGATLAGKLDTAGQPNRAAQIRSRCGYLTNQSKAIYARALGTQERAMLATHLKKLQALITDATAALKAPPTTP